MSRFLRRAHLYAALFLGPWVLGYAASTIVMVHGLTAPQAFVSERERPYDAAFAPGTSPREEALQLLDDLGLAGAFTVQGSVEDGRLTVNRQDMLTPRRLIYVPAERRVTVERVVFRTTGFLNRFHHRRTYEQPFVADRAMAASIDAVAIALVFLAASGVWMWWHTPPTRAWGALALASGTGLFTFLAWTL